jgi:glutathione reductase (NADPH)
MVIVGGGYVACEFAGIMGGLGTRVIQLYRGEQILRGFDDDLRDHVAGAMRDRGIVLEVGRDVVGIERDGEGLAVRVDNGETHRVDQVLFATGRNPNTEGLGLEALGVGIAANGAVEVDRWSQTAVPSIYAVGDVTDRYPLTPVAIAEGQAFAETVFEGRPKPVDHSLIPTAVFTRPEAASVGLSEAEAGRRGPAESYETRFRPLANTLSGRGERMLMKLVVDAASRKLLGVHLVGPGSAEQIQLAAVALRMGASKDDFDATIAVHPTAAEELVTLRAPARITS